MSIPLRPVEALPGMLKSANGRRTTVVFGYIAALAAVAMNVVYPAITRVSVTATLTPADLLMLRLGISGLIFAPYLFWNASTIPRRIWIAGVPLSFFHGWGMAACVIFGLQFAPASHAAALGPGALSAWIAVLGFLVYRIAISTQKFLAIGAIITGVLLILVGSAKGLSTANSMTGDVMFLAASGLAAAYLVYVQQNRISPVLGVSLVSTYSAVVLLPWYLLAAKSGFSAASASEIICQAVFQGILSGCVVFLAINYAAQTIGSQTTGMLFALVPALGVVASLLIAKDPVSGIEWIAIFVISGGVVAGAWPAGRSTSPQAAADGVIARRCAQAD
ncbi:DMT family transporter [Bradyrhizobium japonicum]|uniref:DMT family transporter n=2 Tax=Bradyrhizobium japonicum TaxID=375 RepID=UPI001E42D483|nr:DMT family transporter [Bradyrhizobium japonicum]